MKLGELAKEIDNLRKQYGDDVPVAVCTFDQYYVEKTPIFSDDIFVMEGCSKPNEDGNLYLSNEGEKYVIIAVSTEPRDSVNSSEYHKLYNEPIND